MQDGTPEKPIYLENFQPNMKMFDQSMNSVLSGMSAELKAFSPVSILRSSQTRKDDDVIVQSQEIHNINTHPQAKQARQQAT